MLVRLLASIHATEFALYFLFIMGHWLSIGGALCIALGVRALVVVVMFAISETWRGHRPPEMRLGFTGWLRLFFTEYAAFVALYALFQQFDRYFAPRGPVAPGGKAHTPVLFVHGYLCNGGYWWAMRRYLARHGVAQTYVISCEPIFASIDRYAAQVAARIESICAHSGAEKVILVGHSMGGLIARRCVQLHGAARVAKIVSLGSPDHGTVHAALGLGPNARQMCIGGEWIMALNREEGQHSPVPITAVFSYHDNIVAPQESSLVAHAKNIPLKGIGHLAMTFSRPIQKIVLDEITSGD